jgi:pimeloyl-ACP methyl ester carboxylesterase
MFKNYLFLFLLSFISTNIFAQKFIDTGTGTANTLEYGSGSSAVILVHGKGGNAQSWFKSEYSEFGTFAVNEGLRVLSISWAGTLGGSADTQIDMAVKFLNNNGINKISLVGFSAGGGAVARNVRNRPDGTYHAVVQFSSVDDKPILLDKTLKIFAFNLRDECCGRWQSSSSKASSNPKEIYELPSSGHPLKALINEKTDLMEIVISKIK